MRIPKFSKGTLVKIKNFGKLYSGNYWKNQFEDIIFYEQHSIDTTVQWRVVDFIQNKNCIDNIDIIYLLEYNNKHILISEDGIDVRLVIGHQYIDYIPENFTDDKLYDVERWTPLNGGTYVETLAINVSKEVALKYYERSLKSNDTFPWKDGVKIVEHIDRNYFALRHEGFSKSIYNFSEELNYEKWLLTHKYNEYKSDSDTLVFTYNDVNVLFIQLKEFMIKELKNNIQTRTDKDNIDRLMRNKFKNIVFTENGNIESIN